MQASVSNHSTDLRQLLSSAAKVASYSGKKMMESAGLSWQTLAAWKAGTRRPRAGSVRAVGLALVVRGDRIRQMGLELIQAAEHLSNQQRPDLATDKDPQRLLFAPVPGGSALSSKVLDDD